MKFAKQTIRTIVAVAVLAAAGNSVFAFSDESWNLNAAYIKKEFDKKYNPTWHCVVGRNFGS